MKKTIPSLNGLRAISIFIVIFSHLNISSFSGSLAHGTRLLDGQFGVTVFFIISGFLITTLLLQEEAKNSTISLKNFYFKRVLRIFPVYFILLLVYAILQASGILHFSAVSWLTSLTYTKDFKWNSDWETGHLWSLSIEEQFYMFWPLVFMYGKKHRARFAFAIALLSPIFRAIGAYHDYPGLDQFSIFQRCDAIMWGCIFAMYHDRILAYIQRKVAQAKWLLVAPFIFMLFLDLFTQVNHIYDLHLGFALVPLVGSLTGTLASVTIATIIIISIHYQNNFWFRLLNTRLLNYIGVLSYSLYIWQQLFFSHKLGTLASIPLNLLLIFIAANVSYYVIEKPFLKLKDRLKPAKKKVTLHTEQVLQVEQVALDEISYEEVV